MSVTPPNNQPIAVPYNPYGAIDAAGLSPDALMTYCQTRLNGIDSQVKEYFGQQKKSNDDRAAINDALAVLNNYSAGFMQDGNHSAECAKLHDALLQAIEKVGGNTDAGRRLTAVLARVDDTGRDGVRVDGGKISSDEMKAFIDDVKGIQTDLGASSELGMIQLQSLMSQRQVAIQLCTNLVQSLGDQQNKICANVGH